MKTMLIALAVVLFAFAVRADSTIDPAHPFGYGANIGWINTIAETNNGAVLGQSFCTGYLWSANCGWISLGNGPTNGWRYSNESADDWGVNHDGVGNLFGYAYGANIGWIAFEQTNGQARVDLLTGNLSGYAWGANVGWIGLSNAQAFVRTDTLAPGPDTDDDGIPDPWEYKMAGNLTTLSGGGHDEDGDGVPDAGEYPSDTDPLSDLSLLEVTEVGRAGSESNRVTWTVEPTRFYQVEQASALTNGALWTDSGLGAMTPDPGSTMTREVADAGSTAMFYRATAMVPLAP